MPHTAKNKANIPVTFRTDISTLAKKDTNLLQLLIQAAQQVNIIFLRQSNQFGVHPPVAFDTAAPKNFYPEGISAAEVEAYLAEHPEMRTEILSPFTVVTKTADGFLAVPCSEFYKKEMEAIADLLDQAATLVEDEKVQQFLQARSAAFRTNQYRESDIAWIHANSGPFELTIGPYESYEDTLFGVKRTFQCLIGLILKDETALAARFQDFVTQFNAWLGKRYTYTAKPTLTPMVVMDMLYGGGEACYDHVPMAYNLPNDPDIKKEIGSKKVLIRNVMRSKFETITLPIASRLLQEEEVDDFDFEVYLKFIIGHESAHGLSFHFDGERFGPTASPIEECKADVFGMWFLYFLEERAFLEHGVAHHAMKQHLADCIRQMRFGIYKAHAIGAIIQFNWFIDQEALILTEDGLRFNPMQFVEAITTLGDTLYYLAKRGDADVLNDFAAEWGKPIPEKVLMYLTRLADLPIDIDPIFEF